MFGLRRRVKELEEALEELKNDKKCKEGRHSWKYHGSIEGVGEFRACKHCYKTETLVIKENDNDR
jgi:hypothetical protein